MPVATVLKKSLGIKDKKYIIYGVVAVFSLIAVAGASLFIFQQGATRASQSQPSGVEASIGEDGQPNIFFQTAEPVTPAIKFGTSPEALNEVAVGDFDTTNHDISLIGLKPNTTYYYSIEIGGQIFDNSGAPWTFTTGDIASPSPTALTEPETANQITPEIISPTITPSKDITPTDEITNVASPSQALSPSITSWPEFFVTPTATPVSDASPKTCQATSCTEIIQQLGRSCTTQDYLRCINSLSFSTSSGSQASPTITPTRTPTPIAQSIKNLCSVDYVQNNSCTSWTWANSLNKSQTCSNIFTKYFVQCKSTAFDSSTPATWFCNETKTSNELSLPCGLAPKPAAGQAVYCRVRAETEYGGNDQATDWVYGNTTCPAISGDSADCEIGYIQANNCRSWIWDFDYQKDPRCKDKFDKYFFQCTNNGNFNSSSRWFCNQTTTNHYLDLPCYNAAVPGDGESITCRVRAEDSYGESSQASTWVVSTPAICPTSTPTPTPTPTLTPTNTLTPTPTPIPPTATATPTP
jgi:hypothetical protein